VALRKVRQNLMALFHYAAVGGSYMVISLCRRRAGHIVRTLRVKQQARPPRAPPE